jgi:putative salt-induced outer membrane protein YdiY
MSLLRFSRPGRSHRRVQALICAGWLLGLASLLAVQSGFSQYLPGYPAGASPSIEGFTAQPDGFPVPLPNTFAAPPLEGYMVEGLEGLTAPPDPSWTPTPWLEPTQWDRSIEFGLNSSAGNAEAFSLRAGGEMRRKTAWNEIGFDVSYAKATANQAETQHNALFNGGYEHFLSGSRWTVFEKFGLEYDEFRAFDLRLSLNAGVGYMFVKRDSLSWKGRFGAGVSRELGGPLDRWILEAVFGTDYEHQLDDRQKLTATVDYFPAWENFRDYRVVGDVGWEVLLNEDHDLSLKVSVNDRYDSTPHGRRPNDLNYSMLLLWKL